MRSASVEKPVSSTDRQPPCLKYALRSKSLLRRFTPRNDNALELSQSAGHCDSPRRKNLVMVVYRGEEANLFWNFCASIKGFASSLHSSQ